MKLDREFYRLPLRFDAARLAQEVSQFTDAQWRDHPQQYKGNSAICLVSAYGNSRDNAMKGPMLPTPELADCPYIRQVMASFQSPIGRSRLMRIEGKGETEAHVDAAYYWQTRVRIHVPIVTSPEVQFCCGERKAHMAAGEVWLFDTWQLHSVANDGARPRIHLVIDTVGSEFFWQKVSEVADEDAPGAGAVPIINPDLEKPVDFATELFNAPVVMAPGEQQHYLTRLLDELSRSADVLPDQAAEVETILTAFHRQWQAVWACFGATAPGWPHYHALLQQLVPLLEPLKGKITLANGYSFHDTILHWLVYPALNPDLAPRDIASRSAPRRVSPLVKPIIIVSAPRSGSTMLFEVMGRLPGVYTIGDESHTVFETLPKLNPAQRGYESNRAVAADADPELVRELHRRFISLLRDAQGHRPPAGALDLRMVEKTPRNALRVPFLNAVFPDALFIYLYRAPEENVSSMIEAWKSGKFVTYPNLPGWPGPPWSLLLIPGWRELAGRPLAEIAAAQWRVANETILDGLEEIPKTRWVGVTYADLIANPARELGRLMKFSGIPGASAGLAEMPLSKYTLTPPEANKWKKNEEAMRAILPELSAVAARAVAALASGGE